MPSIEEIVQRRRQDATDRKLRAACEEILAVLGNGTPGSRSFQSSSLAYIETGSTISIDDLIEGSETKGRRVFVHKSSIGDPSGIEVYCPTPLWLHKLDEDLQNARQVSELRTKEETRRKSESLRKMFNIRDDELYAVDPAPPAPVPAVPVHTVKQRRFS